MILNEPDGVGSLARGQGTKAAAPRTPAAVGPFDVKIVQRAGHCSHLQSAGIASTAGTAGARTRHTASGAPCVALWSRRLAFVESESRCNKLKVSRRAGSIAQWTFLRTIPADRAARCGMRYLCSSSRKRVHPTLCRSRSGFRTNAAPPTGTRPAFRKGTEYHDWACLAVLVESPTLNVRCSASTAPARWPFFVRTSGMVSKAGRQRL